ncbi:hypothetical protein RvY_01323 [Ramazzottius varieornatus]|uniref:Uncharacterized protein n=1 Tax=Ramazzottius varieornatus TaxID=947166 RepID=A0A1D1UQM5_RAMVA|nr:hypothetical protein RvY_01323 [Ramazzottius varieornatus]
MLLSLSKELHHVIILTEHCLLSNLQASTALKFRRPRLLRILVLQAPFQRPYGEQPEADEAEDLRHTTRDRYTELVSRTISSAYGERLLFNLNNEADSYFKYEKRTPLVRLLTSVSNI